MLYDPLPLLLSSIGNLLKRLEQVVLGFPLTWIMFNSLTVNRSTPSTYLNLLERKPTYEFCFPEGFIPFNVFPIVKGDYNL